MDILKEVINALKTEYSAGATYQALGKKYDVSYTYVHDLINGRRSPEKLSLEFFFKLFPHATINLHGDTMNSIVGNSNNGNNTVTVNEAAASAEAFRTKAVMATTDLDIPAENIIKVQKMLKDLK